MCSRWIVSGAIVLLGWFGCSEPRDFASNEDGVDDESWIDVVSIAHVKSLYRGYPAPRRHPPPGAPPCHSGGGLSG